MFGLHMLFIYSARIFKYNPCAIDLMLSPRILARVIYLIFFFVSSAVEQRTRVGSEIDL
ncbi:MAG: hypothetical protein A4E48_02731 [Methanosaeta sp. PtaU1.Bin060]|jgi:hypothetical protein|nr:MAG: hypothetical protein A4E48_02731 [Methanosaeta sp. PtaU1.Bin060]